MGRAVAWAGVALGATYLIFIGGGWWGIYTSPLRLLTMFIAGAALATWLVVAVRNPSWRPRTLMWPAIVACLGSLALSTAFSRVPRVSLEYLAYAVVLAALYLLLVRLFADPFFRPRLVALFVMLFGAIAVLYVASVIGGWIEWWQLAGLTIPPLRPGFAGLTYGNPSAALTMVVLLAVPTAASIGTASRRGALALIAVAVVVATVAVLSGSRAGWLALGLTFVAAVVATAWAPTLRRSAAQVIGSIFGGRRAVLCLGAVIVLVAAVLVAPAILQRVFAGGESLRLSYAAVALRIFGTSPLVGTGPGMWVIERPGAVLAGEPDDYVPHAHNVEVQTLAELGLVGAVAGIVLIVSIVRLLWRSTRADAAAQRRWAWLSAAGLAYFFLHQLLDFYANMPAFLFAAAIPVAYVDAQALRADQAEGATARWPALRVPPGLRRLGTPVAVGIVAACLLGLIAQEVPALRNDAAVAAADEQHWQAAIGPAREAAAMDPEIAPYQLTAGLAASATGDHAAAAADFRHVVAQTDLPEAWLNLAAEQAALGDVAAAKASIVKGLRLGAQRPALAMAAGDLALRIGDRATAVAAFAAAVAARPSIAADPWWSSGADREALYPDVVASAIARNPTGGWEVQLMAGLGVNTADGLSQRIVSAWRGDPAAIEELTKSCGRDPFDVYELSWCARVARHVSDTSRAAAFTERVALISIGVVDFSFETRVTQPGVQGVALSPINWSTYTYRRSAPFDMLVGSLVHLHLE